MRKWRFLFVLTGCLASIVCLSAEPLRLAYSDVDNAPFQSGTGTAVPAKPGYAVELILRAAADLGLDIRLVRLPNPRVLVQVREGLVDGALTYSYNTERAGYLAYPMIAGGQVDPSRRVHTLSYSFYVQKNSVVQWDGSRLLPSGSAVGANTGYSVVNDLRSLGIVAEESKTIQQNVEKLRQNRIRAYAGQDITVDAWLSREGLADSIVKLSPPIVTKDYYLVFSRQFMDSPRAADALRLWARIGELRDTLLPALIETYLE